METTVCLFLSSLISILGYNHHPAPVAQLVRASYLVAVLAFTAEGAEVIRRSGVMHLGADGDAPEGRVQ